MSQTSLIQKHPKDNQIVYHLSKQVKTSKSAKRWWMYKRHDIATVLTSNLFRRHPRKCVFDMFWTGMPNMLDVISDIHLTDIKAVVWWQVGFFILPVPCAFGCDAGGAGGGRVWPTSTWLVGSCLVEFDKCGTTQGWTNHGFLLHSWRHWKTGNSWLNPPWTTFRWCGIGVGFQSDVLTQLNEHLLVFHLWVGYLLNTSDEKKLRTQIFHGSCSFRGTPVPSEGGLHRMMNKLGRSDI